jgi:hypothetical protein
LVDALNHTIQSVDYQDSWYPQTDGNGFSLIATGNTEDLSQKSAWRPSSQTGGSPGW